MLVGSAQVRVDNPQACRGGHTSPTCAQGVVTLVTVALPVVYSLVLLVRKESWASAQRERVELAKAQVAAECYTLDEGHPTGVPLDVLAVCAPTPLPCPPDTQAPWSRPCPII